MHGTRKRVGHGEVSSKRKKHGGRYVKIKKTEQLQRGGPLVPHEQCPQRTQQSPGAFSRHCSNRVVGSSTLGMQEGTTDLLFKESEEDSSL